jgi:8-oxo-dGTP diphosphatase
MVKRAKSRVSWKRFAHYTCFFQAVERVRSMPLRQHYVATGYVYDRETDSFLLILHKKLGKWLPPGGHLEEGEVPHQGALRELQEETGLRGRIVNLLQTPDVATPSVAQFFSPFCILREIIPATPREDEHVHIDFVYAIEIERADALRIRAEEISQARWIPSQEIPTLETFENVKRVCKAISDLQQRASLFREETLLPELPLELSPTHFPPLDAEQIL